MARQWYYATGDEQHGPVSAAEMRQLAADGELGPDDLIWTDGMDDWVAARSVSGMSFAPPIADNGDDAISISSPRASAVRRRTRGKSRARGRFFAVGTFCKVAAIGKSIVSLFGTARAIVLAILRFPELSLGSDAAATGF